MDKEEITEKAQELTIKNVTDGKNKYYSWGFYKGCVVGLEYTNKQITELEEKISVLLSCKNCPENKGGYICEKEYENKCLSQKIQFIKELKEENAELKEFYEKEYFEIADRTADEKIKELEKYQTEVTIDDYSPYDENTWGMMHEEMFVPKELVRDLLKESYALSEHRNEQLTKAKEIIRTFLSFAEAFGYSPSMDKFITEAEQFLKE